MAKIRSVEIINCKLPDNRFRDTIVDRDKSHTGRPSKAPRHECNRCDLKDLVVLRSSECGVKKDAFGNKIANIKISCPEWSCIHNKYSYSRSR